jgi:hypothetical protein
MPLYLQVNFKNESKAIFTVERPVWIFVWPNLHDIIKGEPPILFNASLSTLIDRGDGSNTTDRGVEGFTWYMLGEKDDDFPQTVGLQDGTQIEYWSLLNSDKLLSSSDIDKKTPFAQFMLEVTEIIPHVRLKEMTEHADTYWDYGDLALSEKSQRRPEKLDGIAVMDYGLDASKIITEYAEIFSIIKLKTNIIPQHENKSAGLRLVRNVINKLLSSPQVESEYYDRVRRKSTTTAIDINSIETNTWEHQKQPIKRTQVLFQEAAKNLIGRLKSY